MDKPKINEVLGQIASYTRLIEQYREELGNIANLGHVVVNYELPCVNVYGERSHTKLLVNTDARDVVAALESSIEKHVALKEQLLDELRELADGQ